MTTALDDYDLPFHNASGQTIPPFAVMQQTWEGAIADRDYFRAVKPNGFGKKFALNGPLPIPAGGQGRGTIARGSFALYDPNITPAPDEELGPIPGQWYLGRLGSGFIVDGELAGNPPSLPGFPTLASSRRVRVTIQPAAGKSEQLVRFELKADKTLPSPPFGEAYILDANDQVITDAEIIVIDRPPTIFAGFGPYTDKKYGVQPGNRGWAQFKSGDYGGTGKPGFEIIAMDGQARWVEGTLGNAWEPSDTFGRMEISSYWGAAPNNRPPKTEEYEFGGGTTGTPSDKRNIVKIYDPALLHTATLEEGAIVRGVWDETQGRYLLAAVPAGGLAGGLYRTTTTITAATFADTTLTMGQGSAQKFNLVEGSSPKRWTLDSSETVTLYNSVGQIQPGRNVQVKPIDGVLTIDVDSCG